MKNMNCIDQISITPYLFYVRLIILVVTFTLYTLTTTAQQGKDWDGGGEIEDVEIEIVKERQITLPEANRNYEKIPPRASEPISPPIKYDFQSFNFSAPQVSPLIRPLKLKQENSSKIYGGFLRVGYGNYQSPLLEGYINSRKDRSKLVGAHIYHRSSDKGPVDGRNSGSGNTSLSVFGKSFSDNIALSGNVDFENRTTHFYGYPENIEVDKEDIKQSINVFKLGGSLSNTKNSTVAYTLGGTFNYLADRYEARETDVDFAFNSSYKMDEEAKININAGYSIISRKDTAVDAKARSLFFITPTYNFMPAPDLKMTFGLTAAFENDTIGKKDFHLYPLVKATYPVSPSVDLEGSLGGGMEKVSLRSLSYQNIWLAPNVPVFHTNRYYEVIFGLNARVGNKVGARAGLSMASFRNQYFFINSEEDQSKFDVVYDEGLMQQTNLYGALSYAQSETAKFMLRADYFVYGTQFQREAWHRPKYKLTADASFNFNQKLYFNVNMIAQGGLKALDPNTDRTVTLDAAFDLNIKTEYLLTDSFSIFVQFNNITSNKYPVFLYYPVRGLQFMAGITWSF